jgi:hypothetical protein
LSGFKDNLSNFWSGRWCSTWDCAISGSSADVSGSIKLLVHYFENGNVQFEVPPQKNKCRGRSANPEFKLKILEHAMGNFGRLSGTDAQNMLHQATERGPYADRLELLNFNPQNCIFSRIQQCSPLYNR